MRGERRIFRGADANSLVATLYGHGPPVLLLHGGGQTRHAFAETARAIAEHGFCAIIVDQRGHGDSEWPPQGAYSFEDFGRDVIALADALTSLGGLRPIAVGASMGGLASLLALGARRDGLRGLVLVDVTPRMDGDGLRKIERFMVSSGAKGFASLEEAADAVAAYLPHRSKPASREGLRKNLRPSPDGRLRWHWDPRFFTGPTSVHADLPAVQPRLFESARALRIPTLLVRGRESELVTPACAREFREMVPYAEFAEISGARHMVAGDRNTIFARAVIDFLTRRFGAQGEIAQQTP